MAYQQNQYPSFNARRDTFTQQRQRLDRVCVTSRESKPTLQARDSQAAQDEDSRSPFTKTVDKLTEVCFVQKKILFLI